MPEPIEIRVRIIDGNYVTEPIEIEGNDGDHMPEPIQMKVIVLNPADVPSST